MPMRVGTTVHALPAPDATVTKCGIPLRQVGSLAGFAGERTKARVTCPECRRIGSADFARGWDAAIARGMTGEDDEPEAERPTIETAFLSLPADDPATLRDFIQRAEADLARSDGTTAMWPAFAADVRRAVGLARAQLGDGRHFSFRGSANGWSFCPRRMRAEPHPPHWEGRTYPSDVPCYCAGVEGELLDGGRLVIAYDDDCQVGSPSRLGYLAGVYRVEPPSRAED